jgi:Zn finger protein HypA/HybF involved in hydrogenase expression
MMKAAKIKIKTEDFRVWCEYCSIRIAPNEEHTMVRDKAYHVRCHSKISKEVGPKA